MVSSYQRSRSGSKHSSSSQTSTPSTSAGPSSSVAAGSSRNSNGQSVGGSNRLCAQCRNHGLRVPVRGHKRYCQFRTCSCRECRLVRERQRVVALHLYVRRAQEQEEEAAAAAEAASTSSQSQGEHVLIPHASSRESPVPETSNEANNIHLAAQHNSRTAEIASAVDARESMLYQSLMELWGSFPTVSGAGLPLLLCILKNSRSVHEASSKIVQGYRDFAASGLQETFARRTPYV